MTFRELEEKYCIFYAPESNPSSLSSWYVSVRDVSLSSLEISDLCRSIRQEVFVADVLPFAMSVLGGDVLAGDFYDGELITVLARLGEDFWCNHKKELEEIADLSHDALLLTTDQQLAADIRSLIDLSKRLIALSQDPAM